MLCSILHFCLVHMIYLCSEINANDKINNGWIPSSSDQVNSLLRRSFQNNPIVNNAEATHEVNNNFNKFMDASDNINAFQSDSENNNIRCKEQDVTSCIKTNEERTLQGDKNFIPYSHNKLISSENTSPSNNLRRAKVISDYNSNLIVNYDNTKDFYDNKDIEILEDNENTYEVTELNDADVPKIEQAATELGYQYEPKKRVAGNNLTNTFLNILSKHNIGTDDNLSNYDLSLRYNNHGLSKDQLVKFPYRYNNLNHLPVNPLLAVLLSNYGYYIPGLYGINTNYNNLYGYLASNNIHNNRPFGLYKVFSDTDSSNK